MKTTNLGFPNVYKSLIKKAVEGFWKGRSSLDDIIRAKEEVQDFNARAQVSLDLQPVFDIDVYDRLLRTAVMFGIVPKRFGTPLEANQDLGVYLSIARGTAQAPASPMVKWFNTNYHVVQPEIEQDPFLVADPRLPDLTGDNKKLALIGPWTLLCYAIDKTGQGKEKLFRKLTEQYVTFLNSLPDVVVQLEEPSFLTDGIPKDYGDFAGELKRDIHLHVYFGPVNEFAEGLFALPVEGIGLDFVDGASNLELLAEFPEDKVLIAGVVNGRNVWPASIRTKRTLEAILKKIPEERLYISPSCSLMHVPLTAEGEEGDFSFAVEKLQELEAISNGTISYTEIQTEEVALPGERYGRSRKSFWISDIPYPTTTIGSFPQTPELRKARRAWKEGKTSDAEYEQFVKGYIRDCVERQEELGLDVLVHGEPERADMVQFFAEHFEGFAAIRGAVQSYGTRHVRPPVITGPIRRPAAITAKWIQYAQSLTAKPVKGILTGPVTMVQWSYPREDISREAQFYEVAAALAEEVDDLVRAGIRHIQIDEPALREALPLERSRRALYLKHAVNAFRLVYARVPDEIVVHSHMCFSDFPDIMSAIREMGVDVLSIEDSKAKGKTAVSIREGGFPGSIGLGVFDVHSPRIPTVEEMIVIPSSLNMDPRRIWINPDCGLKTRTKEEAYTQLYRMVEAVKILRERQPLTPR
jgi:5-methyltetrahydropteroyltriglutamate--homocysteine methyltransferase